MIVSMGASAFLAAAVRRPGVVGAVAPSSLGLAKLLSAAVPRSGRPVVVELGAGTGAVSRVIDGLLPDAGRHLAVEVDAGLVAHLRRALPHVEVVPGDAAELAELLAGRGVSRVDVVVGGLPWALFPPALRTASSVRS